MSLHIRIASLFFFFLLMFSMDLSAQAQGWPMLNLNKERTSWVSQETVLHPPLEKIKEYDCSAWGTSLDNLSLLDNVLCAAVGGAPNTLAVLDIGSGDSLWSFQVPGSGGSMSFTGAQTESLIFAGGQKGTGLHALDRKTGKQMWYKPIKQLYTRNLILDGDIGFILGDSLYCLNLVDGSTVWSHALSLQATPAVDDSYVYVAGVYKIQIFDKVDGTLLWQKPISHRTNGNITVDDRYFYTTSTDTVFAFDKESRDVLWTYPNPGKELYGMSDNSLAITDDILCFTVKSNADSNGQIIALDKATGKYRWEYTFTGEWMSGPVIANGVVYVVPMREYSLYGFDLENGTTLFCDSSVNYRGQPIVVQHRLYASTASKVFVFANVGTAVDDSYSTPQDYQLLQNYPNPFNPETTIKFVLGRSESVTLKIYNSLGEEVHTLLNERRSAGRHSVVYDGSNLTSGLYYYRLVAGSFTGTKKLLLLK